MERISGALYERSRGFAWARLPEERKERWRAIVRELLHRDVIRVGARPLVDAPMAGQIEFEEASGG